ncbi:MAG: CDP-alcohol phosphatidyltransferase family protein, partial [Eggerthellaceae bacterium]|nr:CDP-alcohol phosphatidyltransferase family protein [Eggerthellaceae bacterium]
MAAISAKVNMVTSTQTHIIPQVPTVLTASRIVCSVLMLLTQAFSTEFFVLYLWCGLSDVLDGYIARKAKCTSDFGAKLDSVADLVFSVALLLVLFQALLWELWMFLWIYLIVGIRVLSVLVGAVKFHT